MKKVILLMVLLVVLAFPTEAKIRPETFSSAETLTAGKLFLNQIDTVCLYLATERIVYTPDLDPETLHLRMNLTLLDLAYQPQSEQLKNFVLRHIKTFNKALKGRLEFYTPELAKEFDAQQDVEFFIQVGPERKKVAHFKEDKWIWLAQTTPTPSASPVEITEALPTKEEPAAVDLSECKKKCPALKKPKEKKIVGEDLPL